MPKKPELSDARQERRKLAEQDLEQFICLVHPLRLLGNVHREIIRWWTCADANHNMGLLLPRDHMKSALVAYWVVWMLTRDPTLRILYISSTSNLATKQLKFIKDILTCDVYRLYWPEMVNKDEQKREKWTEREISVDHPKRKEESIRDPSIFTAGLTSNIVGMHCDIDVLDDVVVASNAYTEDGREKVREQYGYLSSVEAAGARQMFVGTRYHPKDLYNDLASMELEEYDEIGNVNKRTPLYDIREYVVETAGDGTGEFIWPRQQRYDGKWFGFDEKILAEKRSKYKNRQHFRAQYYNDPHDIDSSPIKRDLFQYYDQNFLNRRDGKWQMKGERLNIFASVDFAYSLGKDSDYSSIVVVGVDGNRNYYILEIDRFKTDSIAEYYNIILKLYEKWGFRKLRAEVSVAQVVIVKDLKENYIRRNGLSITIDEYRPSRFQGNKEERIRAILEPKYSNREIWHYGGGNCQALEEELIMSNPPHDDIKDALASCIDFAVPPTNYFTTRTEAPQQNNYHSRFGGYI